MKIAILNSSDIAKRRIIPALHKIEGVEITIICSRDLQKAKAYAEEFGISAYTNNVEDIKGVDAVYISSPPSLHYKSIKDFIEKGINIFCEKSLTINPGETKHLINEAEKKGLIIQENYAFQYHPQWRWISENIHKIGKLQYIKASFEFPPRDSSKDFRYNKELGGGSLFDAGGYPLKMASLLMDEITFCKSTKRMSQTHSVDLSGNCYLIDNKGVSAFLSWSFESNYRCDMELVGSAGTLKSNKIFTPREEELVDVILDYRNGNTESQSFSGDHFVHILEDFKRRIETNDTSHHINIIKQSNLQAYVSTFSISTFTN